VNSLIKLNNQKKNILLTSSSAKISLYNSICHAAKRIDKEITIIPADSNENVLSKYLSSEFKLMPETKDNNLNEIIDFLFDNNIGIIFPSRDGELIFWAKYKGKLEELGFNVVVSPLLSVRVCLDKLEFYRFGHRNGFSFIKTFNEFENMSSNNRYVVKQRFGAGSKNIFLNISKSEAIDIARDLPEYIFQPFIEGREFSVDAWLDKHNELKGIILRYRDLTIHGESQITTTFRNHKIEKKLAQNLRQLKLSGPIVMQAIIDKNSDLHVIECNPRFGGASCLSIKAGLDSIYWSICEAFGYNVNELPFDRTDVQIRQIRVPKDTYEYDNCF